MTPLKAAFTALSAGYLLNNLPGFKISCGSRACFTAIKQAVGIKKTDPAVLQFLNDLIATLIQDGFIAASLAAHGVADKLSLPEPTKTQA